MLIPLRLDVDPLVGSPLPLDLTLVKQHLAIDYDDQDALIEQYVLAAIRAFEDTTHRTVYSRDHRWVLKDFPQWNYEHIDLPRGRTTAVESIVYYQGGAATTLRGPTSAGSPTGTDYQEDLRGDHGGVLMPPLASSWPSVDVDHVAPVTITFTAGWDSAEVPPDITQALLWYVRTALDDNRSDPMKATANASVFEAMVSGWRLDGFY
jgi:uncharacterized phiE125 gp8 family phage protein